MRCAGKCGEACGFYTYGIGAPCGQLDRKAAVAAGYGSEVRAGRGIRFDVGSSYGTSGWIEHRAGEPRGYG